MKIKQAQSIAGTLSSPSKMPCKSYSLPAGRCRIGSELRKVPGSVCSKCYAHKGCYVFPRTKKAMAKRYESLENPYWFDAIVLMIKASTKKIKYFRWHDSGDVNDIFHLWQIVLIAKELPEVKFWLPTKEMAVINDYKAGGCHDVIPFNLLIRVSAQMIDWRAPEFPNTCTTVTRGATCPATKPRSIGKCGACRKCWDPKVKNVSYLLH